VLAGVAGRRTVFAASLAAIGCAIVLLWVAELAGLLIASLPAGESAYLALATVSVVPVFVGVGALASQLAPTRRLALELGGAVVALAFFLRVIADTSDRLGWLRWATPLGWAEELRPFTGARPLALVAPAACTAVLLVIAWTIAAGRDVGRGLLPGRDEAPPRLALLGSSTALALRLERASLAVWAGGVGAFALIVGVVSKSISAAGISKQLQRELDKVGVSSITTPRGYIGFAFIFFVLALSLFMCTQVAGARHDEADQRLETLLALPVARRGWLWGRLALAAGAALAIALVAGVLAWVGAVAEGVSLPFGRMLVAGLNCLPVALLFLGIAALAYALAPRAGAGIGYGLVTVGFLWQLFGALLGAPRWLVDATPFAHVGLVPAAAFRPGPAAVMVAIGGVAAAVAVAAFARRDLLGA
jgi:ABC-2 type transport system permease protein